ncbi:hypothetical protein CDD83_8543 [Cordyceps sp. RAO-2017]|nr:hypothetical protein CDD83_8543 [Cordyceps sp. RAO-2017]
MPFLPGPAPLLASAARPVAAPAAFVYQPPPPRARASLSPFSRSSPALPRGSALPLLPAASAAAAAAAAVHPASSAGPARVIGKAALSPRRWRRKLGRLRRGASLRRLRGPTPPPPPSPPASSSSSHHQHHHHHHQTPPSSRASSNTTQACRRYQTSPPPPLPLARAVRMLAASQRRMSSLLLLRHPWPPAPTALAPAALLVLGAGVPLGRLT